MANAAIVIFALVAVIVMVNIWRGTAADKDRLPLACALGIIAIIIATFLILN